MIVQCLCYHVYPCRFVLQLLNDQTPQDTLSEALSVHETLAERRTSSHHLPVRTWEEFVEGCSSSATGTNGAKKTSSVQMPLRLTNVPTFQASMWTPVQHLVRERSSCVSVFERFFLSHGTTSGFLMSDACCVVHLALSAILDALISSSR